MQIMLIPCQLQKRMAKELESFDVRWFEEPVVPEDIAGYREVQKTMIC